MIDSPMPGDIDHRSTQRQPFDGGPLADPGERRAIFTVLDSFRQYRRQTHFNTTHRRRQNFYALPRAHQLLLDGIDVGLLETLSSIDDAIDDNADIADAILGLALQTFGLDREEECSGREEWHDVARPHDLTKAHSTIKQFWRDWSEEGFRGEVKPLLERIVHMLDEYTSLPRPQTRVLLPGAGLGRLLFELCVAGFSVEGNEISYHQLLSSNFILNTTERANQYRLHPFVTNFNNNLSRQDQLHSVTIPDVHPAGTIAQRLAKGGTVGEMNMTAGDFITSYSNPESKSIFDAVVTVYFIDTAPNIIRYIETILHCLKADGIWINVGPLLWHFEDRTAGAKHSHQEGGEDKKGENNSTGNEVGIAEPGSFELSNDETLALIQRMGFRLMRNEILPASTGGYVQDPHSMLQHNYRCSHWVMKKM